MSHHVTNATFEQDVLSAPGPVLVDFWADWCRPCDAVAPVLERIAQERNLKLVKVNCDEEQDLAERYGVQSIPNIILFRRRRAEVANDRCTAEERSRARTRSGSVGTTGR